MEKKNSQHLTEGVKEVARRAGAVLVGVASALGSDVRFYRTVFLEESSRDFVRTARAKGASEARIMTHHVLRNALIPILTRVVLAIPFLFMGALLL